MTTTVSVSMTLAGPLYAVDFSTEEERAAERARQEAIHDGAWVVRLKEHRCEVTHEEAERLLFEARTLRKLRRARSRR